MMNSTESNRWQKTKGTWGWGLLLILVVGLPFGEGGATPLALLANHTLILMAAGWLLLTRVPAPNLLPPGLALGIPLYLAALLASSWGSPYPYASFLRLWDLGVAAILFWVARRVPWSEARKDLLLDAVLGTATFQAMIVLWGLTAGGLEDLLNRLGLLNSNHQAAYLSLVVFITTLRLTRGHLWIRLARLVGMLLCLASSCLLASRGAWLGLGVGALVLLIGIRKQLSVSLFRVAVVFSMVVLLAGAVGIWNRFSASEDIYRYERLRIWEADLRCFVGQPALGVGPGIFRHVAHRYNFPLSGPVRYERTFSTPHSDLLGLLAETGLLGFSFGALVILSVGIHLVRAARGKSLSSLALLAGGIAAGVQGGVDDLSQRPAILLTLALLFALQTVPSPPNPVAPNLGPTRKWVWMAPALVLLWILAVWNPFLAFRSDGLMRRARSLPEMERHFSATLTANPFQADSYRFPVTAFLATRPEVPLTLDLYERFRHDVDRGLRWDRTSADLEIALARLESRAWSELFFDDFARDRALAAYRAAVLKAPLDPRPRLELSEFLRAIGRSPEALQQVERALETEPIYYQAHISRIRLLLEGGSLTEARASWERFRALRKQLVDYRPSSPYAADLVRVSPEQLRELKEALGSS